MDVNEFNEMFPVEPPRGSIIIGKSSVKYKGRGGDWSMIFAAVRRDDKDGMWYYPAINDPDVQISWAEICNLFVDFVDDPARYEIIDWYISEGSHTDGKHS
jgi:hypothetical protein